MSTYDLLIRNGTLISSQGIQQADLAVAEGKIVDIAAFLTGSACEVIDASGLRIFPGVIDGHVHCCEPGRVQWEGFSHASRALVAGGTTTFFDMPLYSYPPTLDARSFAEKRSLGEVSSYADFVLWGGLIPSNLDRLEELADCGVVGYQAFMCDSGVDDFPCVDDFTLYRGMEYAAQLHKMVVVHAENEALTAGLAQEALAQGRVGIRDYLASRPVIAELEAIARAILFAQQTGCSLHIAQVSTGRGVRMVADARAQGIDVSCGTCPHYLVLTEEDVVTIGALALSAPPIRSRREQESLWQHIATGTLPMVASAHSPASLDMKSRANVFSVHRGIAGGQSLLPLLLTEGYSRRHLNLSIIANITSEYVARRFQLGSRKGQLVVGADADLTFVALQDHVLLTAQDLFYRHRQSPYVGLTLQGRVVRTVVRGMTVFLEGHIVGEPGGRLLRVSM